MSYIQLDLAINERLPLAFLSCVPAGLREGFEFGLYESSLPSPDGYNFQLDVPSFSRREDNSFGIARFRWSAKVLVKNPPSELLGEMS